MAKGIIYIMTTAVPGLIKIGKTNAGGYKQRMYNLEHDGYRNVTALKREFAIEVENYDEKEAMLHNIFEKSRVANTELFAVDINLVRQLLSSFDGTVIFPETETKQEVFQHSAEQTTGHIIPDGTYYFKRKKKSDNKTVYATAAIENGSWTLRRGSILGIHEDAGCADVAREFRASLPMDSNGRLLEDVELGVCSPSFAGNVVMNQSCNGWDEWKTKDGIKLDFYRKQNAHE